MHDVPVPAILIDDLLQEAYTAISQHVHAFGDGLLHGGTFAWQGAGGMFLTTENSNNHQQTYGVLMAALKALHEFMSQRGFGAAYFSIFDGGREVGMGAVG